MTDQTHESEVQKLMEDGGYILSGTERFILGVFAESISQQAPKVWLKQYARLFDQLCNAGLLERSGDTLKTTNEGRIALGLPIDVTPLIDKAYNELRQQEQAAAEAKLAAKQKRIDDARAEFRQVLETDLGTELIAALGIRYEHYEDRSDQLIVVARFTFETAHLTLSLKRRTYGLLASRQWTLGPTLSANGYVIGPEWLKPTNTIQTEPDTLRDTLLANLGIVRQMRADYDAEQTRQAEAKAIQDAERAATVQRQAQEQKERQAQIAAQMEIWNAEQARLQAVVDQAREKAIAAAWRWPEGVRVTIFRATWCDGIGYDEGQPYTSTEAGWTLTDRLADDGYLHLQKARYERERHVRLDMQVHKPVWEAITINDMDSLPDALSEQMGMRIQGVCWGERSDHPNHSYHRGWVENPEESFSSPLDLSQPVEWVRRLVDAAAGRL
jgi:hypothetical protein